MLRRSLCLFQRSLSCSLALQFGLSLEAIVLGRLLLKLGCLSLLVCGFHLSTLLICCDALKLCVRSRCFCCLPCDLLPDGLRQCHLLQMLCLCRKPQRLHLPSLFFLFYRSLGVSLTLQPRLSLGTIVQSCVSLLLRRLSLLERSFSLGTLLQS